MRSVRPLWRRHPVALALFGLASLAALLFAVRLAVFTIYWADPAHRQLSPEPWMTPGYLARSWGRDPAEIGAALGFDAPPSDRPTLAEIAAERGIPVEVLLAEVAAFLAEGAP